MIEVLDGGPLTTVQTPRGRRSWRHLGVPLGGAADRWSAALANRLVGNAPDAAVLEATLAGPTLRFESTALVALTGASWEATLNGMPLARNQARHARAGSVLDVASGLGCRAYVAVAGLRVPSVLGSEATDLRTGFGGHEGRALRAGDRLDIDMASRTPMRWLGDERAGAPLRVVRGPHAGWFDLDALAAASWRVSEAADRTGVRLEGAEIERVAGSAEIPSIGVHEGAIQVPPSGAPIVMLADGPVTGGYPVPACVVAADLGRVAQLRPGDGVRFASVTVEEAVAALRAATAELDLVEPFSVTGDDELGWAGSLG